MENLNKHIPSIQTLNAIGVQPKTISGVREFLVANTELWLRTCPGGTQESNREVEGWAESNSLRCELVFALGCAGYTDFPPLVKDWRKISQRLPSVAIDYFYGKWRDDFISHHSSGFGYEPYGRAMARERLNWSNIYRGAQSIAASFSDWKSFDRLLEWPGPDLPFDEGTDDRTPEDNAFHIWLAMTLRGEGEKAKPQRVKIEEGSRRRPRMLLAIADAVLAGDAKTVAAEMTKYLKYYLKNEFRPNRIDFAIACDANILWHVARRRGLGEIALPDEVFFLIVRPK